MIRARENPLAWRAGILSVLVHLVLLAILLISFNWHSAKPLSVAQVELWDSVPEVQPPQPVPAPVPEPEPPKPAPVPEVKPEIVVKNKPPVEVKPKQEDKPKPDLAKLAREEELKRQKELEQKQLEKKQLEKEREEKARQEAERKEKIKQLQQQLLAEDSKPAEKAQPNKEAQAAEQARAQQAAADGDKYTGQISAKIRPYVNKQLCGNGKTELTYEIALLPTGEIIGNPKLIKSSGIGACDDAVYRAILAARPLPKPPAGVDRDLKLIFHPNDAG